MKASAGRMFNQYAVIHSGLGLWHLNSNDKLSIEFVADDMVNSLFPVVNANGSISWEVSEKRTMYFSSLYIVLKF